MLVSLCSRALIKQGKHRLLSVRCGYGPGRFMRNRRVLRVPDRPSPIKSDSRSGPACYLVAFDSALCSPQFRRVAHCESATRIRIPNSNTYSGLASASCHQRLFASHGRQILGQWLETSDFSVVFTWVCCTRRCTRFQNDGSPSRDQRRRWGDPGSGHRWPIGCVV